MSKDLNRFFASRVLKFSKEKQTKNKVLLQLSLVRLVVFISGIILVLYFSNEREFLYLLSFLSVALGVYTYLVFKSSEIEKDLQRIGMLLKVNQDEIHRLERKLDGLDNGNEYADSLHPFTRDLAVFGDFSLFHSLFQLMNRTSTKNGEKLLADLLKCNQKLADIKERQEAIAELAGHIDWRQKFEATKSPRSQANDVTSFSTFIVGLKPVKCLPCMGMFFIFPFLLLTTAVHGGSMGFTFYHLIICIIILTINGFIHIFLSKKYKQVFKVSSNYYALIIDYFKMLSVISGTTFVSQRLNKAKAVFNPSGQDNYQGPLESLTVLLKGLADRGGLLSAIFITDAFWLMKLELWRRKNGNLDLPEVFRTVNEFEVLVSIAGFAYINPDFVFPEVAESQEIIFKAEDLGHPLIKRSQRVTNNFELAGNARVVLLTGPNMSGKSTFLKSVGINTVLALTGSPVCAKRFVITPVRLFVSMKNEDNLKENSSSFYAEIKRIEQLIKIAETDGNTFYIIDEIFKGTNSVDQIKGAVAVIRHLKRLNASGFISTHNSQLALYSRIDNTIRNVCFESRNDNNRVLFDYKIQEELRKVLLPVA